MVDLAKKEDQAIPYQSEIVFARKQKRLKENGDLRSIGYYDEFDNVRCIEHYDYLEESKNQITEQSFYDEFGNRNGLHKFWGSTGKLTHHFQYKNGFKDGVQLKYSPQGFEIEKENYLAGNKQGMQNYSNVSGKHMRKEHFLNDRQHGIQQVMGAGKEYYWKGYKISQAEWWLKENTKDIHSLKDITFKKVKEMAIALFQENKNSPCIAKAVSASVLNQSPV